MLSAHRMAGSTVPVNRTRSLGQVDALSRCHALGGKPLLVGLAWCSVAEAFDEPLGVVGVDELGDGLAQIVDVAVGPGPQALFLERLDPALGAAVAFRLAWKSR